MLVTRQQLVRCRERFRCQHRAVRRDQELVARLDLLQPLVHAGEGNALVRVGLATVSGLDGPGKTLDFLGSRDLGFALWITRVGRVGHASALGDGSNGDLRVLGNQLAARLPDVRIGYVELIVDRSGLGPWTGSMTNTASTP